MSHTVLGGRALGNAHEGQDTIARATYVTAIGKRTVVARVFTKKSRKSPRHGIKVALERAKEVTS